MSYRASYGLRVCHAIRATSSHRTRPSPFTSAHRRPFVGGATVGVAVAGRGVDVRVAVAGTAVGVRVAVGGTAVFVRVAVAGTAVLVRVAVGGTGVFVRVAVGGTGVLVAVGGTGVGVFVAVGGTGVFVRVGVAVGLPTMIVTVRVAWPPRGSVARSMMTCVPTTRLFRVNDVPVPNPGCRFEFQII